MPNRHRAKLILMSIVTLGFIGIPRSVATEPKGFVSHAGVANNPSLFGLSGHHPRHVPFLVRPASLPGSKAVVAV